MNRIKLFAIPYAGGSANTYMKWKNYISPMIEMIPIELAGRGNRFDEAPYGTFEKCVDNILDIMTKHGLESPYAIWGHSMGAKLTYEVTRKIIEHKRNRPMRLLLSACRCPQSLRSLKEMHTLPEKEFVDELKKLGGMEEEVFMNEELMNIFLPIIRKDYQMLSTFQYKPMKEKMDIPFSVLYGLKDDIFAEELKGWEMLTKKQCEFLPYEGGHFYINEKYPEIVSYVNQVLTTDSVKL